MSIISIKYKSDNTQHSSCSVCLEEFKDNETISKTSCNHMFHENCLETWLKTNIKCPFCRQLQFKNHFKYNVLDNDLYLWREKQKRKLEFGIYCKEELINRVKKMIEITNTQLEELKEFPSMVEATQKSLRLFTEQMDELKKEMDEKIEKLVIYD